MEPQKISTAIFTLDEPMRKMSGSKELVELITPRLDHSDDIFLFERENQIFYDHQGYRLTVTGVKQSV